MIYCDIEVPCMIANETRGKNKERQRVALMKRQLVTYCFQK